jgi:hypothetical protein
LWIGDFSMVAVSFDSCDQDGQVEPG